MKHIYEDCDLRCECGEILEVAENLKIFATLTYGAKTNYKKEPIYVAGGLKLKCKCGQKYKITDAPILIKEEKWQRKK